MGIDRKSGQNMEKNLEQAPDLEWLAGQLFRFFTQSQRDNLEI
jgi:hypothetical protein